MAVRPPDADPEGETLVRIDVKTRRPGDGPGGLPQVWDIGAKGVQLTGPRDFLVLVALGDEDQSPRYWIVPAEVAADVARLYPRRCNISRTDVADFENRWDLLDAVARRYE